PPSSPTFFRKERVQGRRWEIYRPERELPATPMKTSHNLRYFNTVAASSIFTPSCSRRIFTSVGFSWSWSLRRRDSLRSWMPGLGGDTPGSELCNDRTTHDSFIHRISPSSGLSFNIFIVEDLKHACQRVNECRECAISDSMNVETRWVWCQSKDT